MFNIHKKSQYLSIIEFNGRKLLFENNPTQRITICHDGQIKHVIITDSGANHNFSLFRDGDIIRAIGGQDSWKNDLEWYHCKSNKEFIAHFEKRFKKKFTHDQKFIDNVLSKIRNKKAPLKNSKGLYLFETKDAIKFIPALQAPIITADNDGFTSSLSWKSGEFDSHIWIQKLKDTFFIFLRENIAVGKRFVQYATSKDLKIWSQFQRINIEYEPEINTYFMVGGEYMGKFYCFLPRYDKKNCWIDVYLTDDFQNFDFKKKILFRVAPLFTEKPKNADHPVNGMIRDKFYIHHNYQSRGANVKGYSINDL